MNNLTPEQYVKAIDALAELAAKNAEPHELEDCYYQAQVDHFDSLDLEDLLDAIEAAGIKLSS